MVVRVPRGTFRAASLRARGYAAVDERDRRRPPEAVMQRWHLTLALAAVAGTALIFVPRAPQPRPVEHPATTIPEVTADLAWDDTPASTEALNVEARFDQSSF